MIIKYKNALFWESGLTVVEYMEESTRTKKEQLTLVDVRNVYALLEQGLVKKEQTKDFLEDPNLPRERIRVREQL